MNLHTGLIRKILASPFAYLVCIAAGITGGLLLIFQAKVLSAIVANVFIDGLTLAGVRPLLQKLIFIALCRAFLTIVADVAAKRLAVSIKEQVRKLLIDHLANLGPAYTQNEASGELALAAVQGVEELDAYLSQYLPQLVLAAIVPLAILLFVFPMDVLSGFVLLLTAPLIPIFMVLIGKTSEALTRKQWTALSRLSAHFLDTLHNLKMLKLFNQSRVQAEQVRLVSDRYRVTTMNVLRVTFLSALVLEMAGTLSTAVVAVEIGLRVLYGHMVFQDALFILVMAPEFYLPLRMLGLRFHAGMSGMAAARRIFEVLGSEPLLKQADGEPVEIKQSDISPVFHSPYEIRMKNVSITYPGRSEPALEDINLMIPSGQLTALVGPSGAGKSTLINLLLRFMNPDAGEITCGGIDLVKIPPDEWRKWASWVPQQPYLFFDTLAANIAMSADDIDIQKMRNAAEVASLMKWIETLPKGYETLIGERGARLSGGQAQRLALARAFYCDRPILLLDEPSSNLDAELEEELSRITAELCRSRTVVTIAHRLSTVYNADHIHVLDKGRIVESGSHDTLIRKNGFYCRMVQGTETGA
jgi:thiol reductant ABC exporter CydD subunit